MRNKGDLNAKSLLWSGAHDARRECFADWVALTNLVLENL